MKHLSTAAAERLTLGLTLGLVALAALAPATHLPAHYHHFADQRALGGLPFAMDVLTNLPFALAGAWGLAWLRRATGLAQPQRALAALFFAGLALTALCSGIYHLHPENAGLALDRAGMAVAFAGVVGLAAADRVSGRAGLALAALLLALGPLAAVWDWRTGNMTPWAVLQAAARCCWRCWRCAARAVRSVRSVRMQRLTQERWAFPRWACWASTPLPRRWRWAITRCFTRCMA